MVSLPSDLRTVSVLPARVQLLQLATGLPLPRFLQPLHLGIERPLAQDRLMEGLLLAERMCQAQVPRPLARPAPRTRACFVRSPRSLQGASAAGEDALGDREK